MGRKLLGLIISPRYVAFLRHYNEAHSKQIRLFIEINNHSKPIDFAQRLVQHLSESPGLVPQAIIESLLCKTITMPICGFYNTCFPMWKLGYLIGETWVEEDVMNAHAELVYFQLAVRSGPGTPPPFIFEPTSFFSNARSLYHHVPRQYSPELLLFRQRLLDTCVTSYGFSVWTNGHYAGYYHTPRGITEHGDSMHQPPPCRYLCYSQLGS